MGDKPTPALVGSKGIEFKTPDQLMEFASWVVDAGMAGPLVQGSRRDPELPRDVQIARVFCAVEVGLNHGIKPMVAIAGSMVVNGLHSFWGDLVPAIVQRSGLLLDQKVTTTGDIDEGTYEVTVWAKRKDDGREETATFSIEDAIRAELWNTDRYTKHPKQMLRWRAQHACHRALFPDVLAGINVYEEELEHSEPVDTDYRVVQQAGLSAGQEMPTVDGLAVNDDKPPGAPSGDDKSPVGKSPPDTAKSTPGGPSTEDEETAPSSLGLPPSPSKTPQLSLTALDIIDSIEHCDSSKQLEIVRDQIEKVKEQLAPTDFDHLAAAIRGQQSKLAGDNIEDTDIPF